MRVIDLNKEMKSREGIYFLNRVKTEVGIFNIPLPKKINKFALIRIVEKKLNPKSDIKLITK